jgi:hypothetical protein
MSGFEPSAFSEGHMHCKANMLSSSVLLFACASADSSVCMPVCVRHTATNIVMLL